MPVEENVPDIHLGKRIQSFGGLDINLASATSAYYDLFHRRKNHLQVMLISARLTVKKLNMI